MVGGGGVQRLKHRFWNSNRASVHVLAGDKPGSSLADEANLAYAQFYVIHFKIALIFRAPRNG